MEFMFINNKKLNNSSKGTTWVAELTASSVLYPIDLTIWGLSWYNPHTYDIEATVGYKVTLKSVYLKLNVSKAFSILLLLN